MKVAILPGSARACRTTSRRRRAQAAAEHAFGGGADPEQSLASACASIALLCAALFGCSEEALADCSAFQPGAPLGGEIEVAYLGVHGTAPRTFRGAVFAAEPNEVAIEACGVIEEEVWQVRNHLVQFTHRSGVSDRGSSQRRQHAGHDHLRVLAEVRRRRLLPFRTAGGEANRLDGFARVQFYDPAVATFIARAAITTRLDPIETTTISIEVNWSPEEVPDAM